MNINICGRREEGKTTLALYLARQRHKAVVVFDPRGMIGGYECWGPDELEEAIKERKWESAPLVYRFDGNDTAAEFDSMAEVLFPSGFPHGGFGVIIDEAQMLQNAHSIRPSLDRAMKQHPTFPPREAVTLIQTTHRIVNLHGDNKALMDEFYIFCTTLPRDVDAIEDLCGAEVAAKIQTLEIHQCVRFMYGRKADGVQYEVWSDPEVWYSPLKGVGPLGPSANPEAAPKNKIWKGYQGDASETETEHAASE